MIKRLRSLRLILLFLNYLICLYALCICGFFNGIQINGVYKTLVIVGVSVLIVLSGLILTYFRKNCNIIYCITYTCMLLPLIMYRIDYEKGYSDLSVFCILLLVAMITIFCWYLYIWENKIRKVLDKGASEYEIQKCYSKYLIMYVSFVATVTSLIVGVYIVLQRVSAYVITYLYYMGTIFSIPAVFGFIGIVLVCIFLFVVLYDKDEDKR